MPPDKLAITAALRSAIDQSGIAHKALERETGVKRQSIMRFMRGDQSLRLDMADKLADYLSVSVCAPPRDQLDSVAANEIRATEFHEAGHAVAAAVSHVDLLGKRISVRWNDRECEASGLGIEIPKTLPSKEYCVTLFAGQLAEFKFRAAVHHHRESGEPFPRVLRSLRFAPQEKLSRFIEKLVNLSQTRCEDEDEFGFVEIAFAYAGCRSPFSLRLSITSSERDFLDICQKEDVRGFRLRRHLQTAMQMIDSPANWSAVIDVAESLHCMPDDKSLSGERVVEIVHKARQKPKSPKGK